MTQSVRGACEPVCQQAAAGWGGLGAASGGHVELPPWIPALALHGACLTSFPREAASPRRCVTLLRYILALELGLLAPFASC